MKNKTKLTMEDVKALVSLIALADVYAKTMASERNRDSYLKDAKTVSRLLQDVSWDVLEGEE